MKTYLIGLAGAARSGKDTAATHLARAGWERKAFADPVREALYRLNPVLIDPLGEAGTTTVAYEVDNHGWEYVKSEFPEVRGYLQRCGTEVGRRTLGEDVWVDTLFRDYETWDRPTVITDVRFPNEARAIESRGGLVVQVVRPGRSPIQESAHISERALDGWSFDAQLVNDGTEAQLGRRVTNLVAAL
ncbi:hypothetical protein CIB93_09170 [Streptomyces sp. WZ.A104]|uniref:deoxynucleotide monophosphate kinase family protein n=1 Tax=Streptomyces sp. WZ.A104 TaxID=2023771 RepID=UPI000BBBE30D|nr:hypothetical protein [Streptomyces sp. WZ.A104]PCG86391.1 hypothetical protein CIB93_09170 [Streptomyces sp. WZ.A104]